MSVVVALLIATFYFLFSGDALAWGPITHLDYAHACLQNLSAFTPVVKELLTRFPNDFLYGSLAADITVGKAYVDYIYNCHNWRVGFLLLNEADASGDDRQRTCAYGYLSHLAVDIIAHNYFVPYKTILSYRTRLLGHVYWEMRFDARRPHRIWSLAKKISGEKFPHDDDLFQRILRRTLFSFKTNKRIFNSVMTLHKFRHWKTMMEKVHGISRLRMTDQDIEEYRNLALESVFDFLKDPESAPCTRVDPTGADKLLYATEMRRELKRLRRRGMIDEEMADRFLVKVKKGLRDSIYKPQELPTVGEFF